MNRLPYEHVRIIEQSATLTGRLVGLLFADQGAEVFVERGVAATPGEHDGYLDRGKIGAPPGALADTSPADVIIVDGMTPVSRAATQIALRGPAAPPRIGSDAPAILAELGYTNADVDRLIASGVVGPTEWFQTRNP
jgi:crotonobetainyl-CoA:carnitine CoA-transferase CaiB-like acyl-CoA transferase